MVISDNDQQEIICIRCGDCCEDQIFLDISYLARFRHKFQRKMISALHNAPLEQLAIITEDGKCIFLCSDNTCAIYPDRPVFPCKMFGNPKYLECPKVSPDGKIRSKEEYERINAKNNDLSQWPEAYKEKMNDLAREKAQSLVNKQKYNDEF